MSRLLTILFAILMFGALIFLHELGHFIAARACGVAVNEFSLGMGPVLWKKQRGETLYSLRALPIGGFCAMEGENEDTGDPRAFASKSWWKRLIILAAGAFMNFVTGVILLLLIFSRSQAFVVPQLSGVIEGTSVAEYLQEGDELLSINGSRILLYSDVSTILSRGNGETADFVILRGGEKLTLTDMPCYLTEVEDENGTSMLYGFQFTVREATAGSRISFALKQSVDFVRLVWYGLEDIFTGAVGVRDLSGPIGIVSTMSEVTEESSGWFDALVNLLYFTAFIAINLAVMNLLPLPALDGGRIFFVLVNCVAWLLLRKKIPDRYEGLVHTVGLVLLLGLMVLIAVSDMFRLMGY